jgi:hypothetical protein
MLWCQFFELLAIHMEVSILYDLQAEVSYDDAVQKAPSIRICMESPIICIIKQFNLFYAMQISLLIL